MIFLSIKLFLNIEKITSFFQKSNITLMNKTIILMNKKYE